MSWHFLQEQEEASWAESSLDGAPCALLSLIPTADGCCSPASATDSCRDSRSGTMCRPSTEGRGGDTSMSSVGGSPAPTSRLPKTMHKESTEPPADYGVRCLELLARFDRNTSSWKTVQPLLFEELDGFSETWPDWGSMRDGECWEHATPDSITGESVSGFLPTPRTSLHKQRWFYVRKIYKGNLEELPMVSGYEHLTGKAINPAWLEWMMGWVIGWADLKPLATDKFRSWLRWHGKSLEGQ